MESSLEYRKWNWQTDALMGLMAVATMVIIGCGLALLANANQPSWRVGLAIAIIILVWAGYQYNRIYIRLNEPVEDVSSC